MNIKKVVRIFQRGSVGVSGQRGSGKDMLIGNVIARRNEKYVSNVNYTNDDRYIPLDMSKLECGKNTYRDFIDGKVKKYIYPYPDGTDIYLSDGGVYFPSQYSAELDKKYPYFPTLAALLRQLGNGEIHTNTQAYNRIWNKLREQQDLYIYCLSCQVFGKIVVQRVRFYELAESAEKRIPIYRGLPCLPFSQTWYMQRIRRNEYYVQHGKIKERILIYINKSTYNTRIFKEILANGKEEMP